MCSSDLLSPRCSIKTCWIAARRSAPCRRRVWIVRDVCGCSCSDVGPSPRQPQFRGRANLAHGGVTAAGLVRHWPLEEGSTAVVSGAAGSVGLLLVASLAQRGVSVIGVASGARVERVRAAGAALVIDRSTEDVGQGARRATDGRGVSAVFDPVGAATYRTNLQLLAPRGCLINYGPIARWRRANLPT